MSGEAIMLVETQSIALMTEHWEIPTPDTPLDTDEQRVAHADAAIKAGTARLVAHDPTDHRDRVIVRIDDGFVYHKPLPRLRDSPS